MLQDYFAIYRPLLPIFDESTLREQYHSFYGGESTSCDAASTVCVLLAIALGSASTEVFDAHLHTAFSLYNDLVARPYLSSVQALILMVLCLFVLGGYVGKLLTSEFRLADLVFLKCRKGWPSRTQYSVCDSDGTINWATSESVHLSPSTGDSLRHEGPRSEEPHLVDMLLLGQVGRCPLYQGESRVQPLTATHYSGNSPLKAAKSLPSATTIATRSCRVYHQSHLQHWDTREPMATFNSTFYLLSSAWPRPSPLFHKPCSTKMCRISGTMNW